MILKLKLARKGLSRIDLVILISACVLLVSLLLPAVERARETARNDQCRSNLHKIAVALNTYHDRHNTFPPAAIWGSEDLNLSELDTHKNPTPVHVTRQNWLQHLLPDLDQSDLAQRFSPSHRVADEQNRAARMTRVSLFICPSDAYNTPENRYEMPMPDGTRVPFARGNYAINGGSEYVPVAFGTLSNPGPTKSKYRYNEATREFQFSGNGIAGINESLRLQDFRNGLATTVAVEEVRSGLAKVDTRGVWALGQIGASITWGHGVLGDDGSPNATEIDKGADDIREGKRLYAELGRDFIDGERMQACAHCDENTQATARSMHQQGVNLATLDGAVHYISNNIEPSLWHVLHSRNTPSGKFPADVTTEYSGPRWKDSPPLKQIAPPKSLPPKIRNSIGMQFTRIPAGTFLMGLPDKDHKLPSPSDAVAHPVTISHDYYLGTHEVTQKQFKELMHCNPSWHSPTGEGKADLKTSSSDDYPVENVSWDDASEFCTQLSLLKSEIQAGRTYRLPTEAEWERACRGGITDAIPYDRKWNEQDKSGIIANKEKPTAPVNTTPVGIFPPNPYGLHDMCGNVFEWVGDYRTKGYYQHSREMDPAGPHLGYLHVIRGWHWVATGAKCKVYVANDPWEGCRFIGFRVICEISSQQELAGISGGRE